LSVVSLPPSSFGLHPSLERQSRCELRAMEPAVCWMFRDPAPSRSGARGSPVPSASSICAMMAAFERGMKPGVDRCFRARTTYDQFPFSGSAINLALVTFAVERMISFLAKVHGQSVIRHGESFARNSRFQRTLGASARSGHGFHLSRFGMSPFGLRASSRVRPARKQRRLDDSWRSGKGIGPRGPSRSACPCSPFITHRPNRT
jgi:hypothetical protein